VTRRPLAGPNVSAGWEIPLGRHARARRALPARGPEEQSPVHCHLPALAVGEIPLRRPARGPAASGGGLAGAVFVLVLLGASAARAEDWPQWRGPASSGVSSAKDLPVRWSRTENLAWTADLAGLGASSPIVWGDLVFATSQVGDARVAPGDAHPQLARDDAALAARERAIGGRRPELQEAAAAEVFFVVEAFRLATGERVWQHRFAATGELPAVHEKHNLATPTPVTDGERVYAWFGNGQVVALDLTGREVWSRHLGEVAPFHNRWGHGSSPALFDDLLLLQVDHDAAAYLLALDKRTGAERWKVEHEAGRERIAHSTPIVVPGSSGPELVLNSGTRIEAYDPRTGALLWHAGSARQTPVPTPVFHDGVLYLARGYRNSDYQALRVGGRGDVTQSHALWRSAGGASYVPSILHHEGLVYVTNEIGVVTCADATTGEALWRERLGGVFFASPVAGDGKVFLVSETGETWVLRAGRTAEAEVLAVNDLGERMLASPAVGGSRLILRSDGRLFAVGE
jgi:outer membrane protein assembly factor BamB